MSRVGQFTSSQVYRLMSKGRGNWSIENVGAPFNSYVKEKLREIRTGRSISGDSSAKSTNWGSFMERYVFDIKLPLEFQLVSKERLKHPALPFSGMPDTLRADFVGDIKCPYTINSFCDLMDSFKAKTIKETHPEYYWQLVANSILSDKPMAELIVYIPYKSELELIREYASNFDGDQNPIAFINWATDEQLPYINEGLYYQDLNVYSFEVPEDDKALLLSRIKLASELLKKLQ